LLLCHKQNQIKFRKMKTPANRLLLYSQYEKEKRVEDLFARAQIPRLGALPGLLARKTQEEIGRRYNRAILFCMILPKKRDPRFITIRRGGKLTDEDHQLLALWAAKCAEHVLPLFEKASSDKRPREAIALIRKWVKGGVKMTEAHNFAFQTNAAGKSLPDHARFAALSAGQAVAVAHVAAHELGAAAYAIRARVAAAPEGKHEEARRKECAWQRKQLPVKIRALVLDDQKKRNALCWRVFE
jgi:hypothetical protein